MLSKPDPDVVRFGVFESIADRFLDDGKDGYLILRVSAGRLVIPSLCANFQMKGCACFFLLPARQKRLQSRHQSLGLQDQRTQFKEKRAHLVAGALPQLYQLYYLFLNQRGVAGQGLLDEIEPHQHAGHQLGGAIVKVTGQLLLDLLLGNHHAVPFGQHALMKSGVLDGNGGIVGYGIQQGEIALGKVTFQLVHDLDDTDDTPFDDHRHAED